MSQSKLNKYYIMHIIQNYDVEPRVYDARYKESFGGFADIVHRSPKEALLSLLTSSDYYIMNSKGVLFKVATCERVSECNDTVNFGVRCMSDPKKIYYYRVVWKEVK